MPENAGRLLPRWLDDLRRDLAHSLRISLQNPGSTFVALTTIALGIGATTAIFSVVNTVLLRPLPYPASDRIVQLEDTYAEVSTRTVGIKEFNFWQQQTTVIQDISASWLDYMNLTGGSNAELIPVALVSSNFFRLYGAPILHGRSFTADEERSGSPHVAVLSYGMWKRRFASKPEVIGTAIALGDVPYVVVGVLGPFDAEQFDQPPDVWVPFQVDPGSSGRDSRLCFVTGRLKPGATLDMARGELRVVGERYRRLFPSRMRPRDSFTVQTLRDAMVGDVRPSLLILAAAVGFVFLIACANVANLLLVRATGRIREVAVRAALGAARSRIVRQLLTESALLSSVGGALGLAFGWLGIRAFLAFYPLAPLGPAVVNPVNIPRVGAAGAGVVLDWRVLSFTALIALLTGLLIGVAPALHMSYADLNAALKESGGRSASGFGRTRTLSVLVIAETAFTLILLIGGGLLTRTSIALRSVSPGFDSRDVLTMQTSLASARFVSAPAVDRLVREGIRRIRALPGVQSAAASCCLPLEAAWQLPFILADRPLNGRFHGFAGWTFVSPEYFEVLHIPLLRGRTFTERDDMSAPGAIIINQTMARLLWPTGDALHARLLIGRSMGPEYDKDPVRQVVGIVGDVRDVELNRAPRPIMYVPVSQVPDDVKALVLPLLPMGWMIRTREKPGPLAAGVANELRLATGGLPVSRIRPLDEVTAQSTARVEFNMALMTTFGCISLLLAAVGIYGVVAYSIGQRTPEIGIRIALGAEPKDVRRMVVTQGIRLIVAGLVVGIAAAFGVTRLIASLLFGVTATDPFVFVMAPLFLSAVAVFSTWLPALSASRIDPIDALRRQ